MVKNKTDKICLLVDVAVPSDRNVLHRVAEKVLKFESLCTEVEEMWNMKCLVMSVVIGGDWICN